MLFINKKNKNKSIRKSLKWDDTNEERKERKKKQVFHNILAIREYTKKENKVEVRGSIRFSSPIHSYNCAKNSCQFKYTLYIYTTYESRTLQK